MNFSDYELVSDGKILQTLTIKIISLYILRSLLNRSAIKRASSLNAIVTIVKRASSFNRDLRVPTYFPKNKLKYIVDPVEHMEMVGTNGICLKQKGLDTCRDISVSYDVMF